MRYLSRCHYGFWNGDVKISFVSLRKHENTKMWQVSGKESCWEPYTENWQVTDKQKESVWDYYNFQDVRLEISTNDNGAMYKENDVEGALCLVCGRCIEDKNNCKYLPKIATEAHTLDTFNIMPIHDKCVEKLKGCVSIFQYYANKANRRLWSLSPPPGLRIPEAHHAYLRHLEGLKKDGKSDPMKDVQYETYKM